MNKLFNATLILMGSMLPATAIAALPVCGDGKRTGTEACDGADLQNKDCTSFDFEGGALSCTAACTFDTSGCNLCGNGVRDAGEPCDHNDLGGAVCSSVGFSGGTLACGPLCTLDTTKCTIAPTPLPPPAPAPAPPPAPVASQQIQWPPDELDVYRVDSGDPTGLPRVILLIDNSSSMNGTAESGGGSCTWFANQYNGGSLKFKKIQLLQAVLNGCESPDDGLFDLFAQKMIFSIHQISDKAAPGSLLAEFTMQTASLEAGILGVNFTANTPMHEGLHVSGKHFDEYWTDGNSKSCAGDYIIMVADGNSAGGAEESFDWASDSAIVSVPSNQPALGSGYLATHDVLTKVGGTQNIFTYSIGIDVTGAAARTTIQDVANAGHGKYFESNDIVSLREAFISIFSLIASRKFATSASYTVQRTPELFTGNIAYTNGYSPQATGQWFGNLKKSCLFPNYRRGKYDTLEQGCLFKSNDGIELVTNPNAVDQWTGTSGSNATTGGAGQLLRDRLASPGNSTPNLPYRPRNITSWKSGPGYRALDGAWSDVELWTIQQQKQAFLNRMQGYTFDADAAGNPVEVPEWVLGETIHPDVQLLKYHHDCNAPGRCFLAMSANDGMLHFFDAADGRETQALVPADLLAPFGIQTKHRLSDIEHQPSNDGLHDYFLDGGLRIFHVDANGNGVIESTEVAYLIVALGRAGHGYYKIPIADFRGTLGTGTPISPWTDPELHETWAGPWLGRVAVGEGVKNVAIFPTGHIPDFDWPDAQVPGLIQGPRKYVSIYDSCADVAAQSGVNPDLCNQWYTAGYPDIGVPVALGPFNIPNAKTVAWQFKFSNVDLDANDRLYVEDSNGYGANAVTGTGQPTEPWSYDLVGGWSNWVMDSSAYVRLKMDGRPTTNRGFVVDGVYRIEERRSAPAPHHPGIYVVDLDAWNGGTKGLLIEIARSCTTGAAGCIDQTSSPDLRYLTCPISGEVSVYNQGLQIRSMYFGDECGQLWRVAPDPNTRVLGVKRLLTMNDADFSEQGVAQGASKDLRKVFRKLDIVLSNCSGENSIGIYFGTGNVQRPNARDELANPALTSGRDVVGVFWDNGASFDKTLADLEDITDVGKIDPKRIRTRGKAGWYFELEEDERMLRDPLVFLGTAYFKTHAPGDNELVCGNSVGTDYVYAVNSCTGEAVDDGDRRSWEGNQDIGGNLLLFTPRSGDSFVSAGSQTLEEDGAINKKKLPSIQLYMWRMPRGYE